MPTMRLTDKGVGKLSAINEKQTEFWDALLPGFALRVTKTGRKSWVIMYRVHGRLRRMTLGQYPKISLLSARTAAREAFEKIEAGIDPADEKRLVQENQPQTFGELADEFIERYAKPNKRSWQNDDRVLKNDILPEWKNKPAEDITRADVIRMLDKIATRAPVSANRALATIRKIFNWSVEKSLLVATPVVAVKAPTKEVSRERVLTDDELKKIWLATEKLGWPWKPYFQMLTLTLQRREEVAGMLHSELNLTASEWTLAGERTKNGKGNMIPLSSMAVDTLTDVERFGSEFVFPAKGSEIDGGKHISGFSKAKARLDKLSGVTGWRVHDLRRTGASNLAKLQVAPHIIEKILNHTSGEISGVAAIYNRYGYDEEKRRALDIWAQCIQDIINEEKGKIIALIAKR